MSANPSDTATVAGRRRFKPYPAYKDSGIEWLGALPVQWHATRLKRVFRIVNGSTPQSSVAEYWDGDIPWVTPEDLGELSGSTIADTRRCITQLGYESCGTTLAPAGSLVLSTRAPVGYLAIARAPVCTNQGCRTLVPRTPTTPEFFYYQLRAAKSELESRAQGSTFKELAGDKLADITLAEPPSDEQRAIAKFLDRETAKIDTLVAEKDRLLDLLHEQRASVITRAVTRGLDPNVPTMDSGVEWLGAIPAHWDFQRIKWIARMESGHTPDKKVAEYWNEGDIPWVSLADTALLRVTDYVADTAVRTTAQGIAHSSARVLPSGTVVFSRDATIGLCAITAAPMAVSQHFIGWVCGERLVPEYLLLVLRSMTQELDRLTMGATVKTIGMPDVKGLATPIPPPDEQRRVVDFVRERRAGLDALLGKVHDAVARLREYRTALISAAVTGKIDVREETP